jgi:murein L,D-transpeptidase YafK
MAKFSRNTKLRWVARQLAPSFRVAITKPQSGTYILDRRNEHSHFYRSLHISYPNDDDRTRAQKHGVAPGGDIMVHGLPNGFGWIGGSHRLRDWTDGCIAVTNEEMDEIWRAVTDGTPIEISP